MKSFVTYHKYCAEYHSYCAISQVVRQKEGESHVDVRLSWYHDLHSLVGWLQYL